MTALWPAAAEERAQTLRRRAAGWQRDGMVTREALTAIEARTAPAWRSHGLILSLVFFIATTLALSAFFALCALMELPKGVITAVVALAVAELLIQRLRFFGTGIESALWIGGLFAFLFGLPSQGKPEALLVFALAAAIAGARVRNAIFGAFAAVLVIAYTSIHIDSIWPPVVTSLVIAAAAVAAMHVEWKRESTDLLFAVTAALAPLAGYAGALFESSHDIRLPFLFGGFGLAVLVLGIRARARALLIAGAVPAIAAAADLQRWIEWPAEAKLIFAGVLLAASAVALQRHLAKRTRGFVATKRSVTRYDEAAKLVSTVAAAPTASAPPADGSLGGGGKFGGAGATGDY